MHTVQYMSPYITYLSILTGLSHLYQAVSNVKFERTKDEANDNM